MDGGTSERTRPAGAGRRLVVVVAVAALAVVGYRVLADGPERAQLGTGPSRTLDEAAGAQQLVTELASALASGDTEVLGDLAPSDRPAAAALLRAIGDNVGRLGIRDLSLRYVDSSDVTLTPAQTARFGRTAWVSDVQLTWRVGGVDDAVSTLEVPVVLDWEGRTPVFESSQVVEEGRRSPLWFTGPLAVRRTPDTLVAAPTAREATSLSRQAVTAVATIRDSLPGWRRPLVVEAAPTTELFQAASGASEDDGRSIAAVTTTSDGSGLDDAPVRVFVNPAIFEPLGPRGRQIVLSHEAAHVALGAATTELPIWLSEGIADYLALVGSPLPVERLGSQILTLVRREGAPADLPGQAEFDGANADIGAYYEAAWLAVRLLGLQHGEDQVLRFYRVAAEDGSTDRAFREVLGTTQPEFVRQWRRHLEELAR